VHCPPEAQCPIVPHRRMRCRFQAVEGTVTRNPANPVARRAGSTVSFAPRLSRSARREAARSLVAGRLEVGERVLAGPDRRATAGSLRRSSARQPVRRSLALDGWGYVKFVAPPAHERLGGAGRAHARSTAGRELCTSHGGIPNENLLRAGMREVVGASWRRAAGVG
jgi:hypothetical protein